MTPNLLPDEYDFQSDTQLAGLSAKAMAEQIVLLAQFGDPPMTVSSGLALMEQLDRQAKVEIAQTQRGKN